MIRTAERRKLIASLGRLLGMPTSGQNRAEKLVAALGGFLGILLVTLISQASAGPTAAVYLVPSMGATAVLLFAVPHGLLSQPWAVIVGHTLSAVVGVSCWNLIATPAIAAAVAVGAALGLMHVTRSVHPPGGATALAAVIGSPDIHALGYMYALFPVAVNALVLVTIAVAFNYVFPWRRYPIALMRFLDRRPLTQPAFSIEEHHIQAAIDETSVLVDVDPGAILQLVSVALDIAHADHRQRLPNIHLGAYYCNDATGLQWCVRQVIDERPSTNPAHDLVIYQVIEGEGARGVRSTTRMEFAAWARSELNPHWEHRN